MRYLTLVVALTGAPAFADCPEPADISAELETLFEKARAAPNDMAAREISGQMWQVWLRAPDEAAQAVLDRGMERRSAYDFVGAMAEFDRLADYCPDYAEGFNQRAYIHFLRGDYELALADLEIALGLSPDHVGARSGKALTLMNLGRREDARRELLLALDNNPWLSERFLLAEGGPLAIDGQDI